MKLNKTMMMAALVAGSVFTAVVAVQAQVATTPAAPATPATPAARPAGPRGGGIDYVATRLALTDDQKAKAKPIFDERRQKMIDLRKDTTLDQTQRRAKIKEISDDANTKLKDIFTPEQYEKWLKMSPGTRRPPGAAGAPPAPVTPPAAAAPKPPQ